MKGGVSVNVKKKGNRGEIELLNLLQSCGISAIRNDQTFTGGQGNPDIDACIRGKPYHIEVKRVEHLNVNEAMNQAVRDADEQHTPVVIHRRNRSVWLVTMRLNDFLKEAEP